MGRWRSHFDRAVSQHRAAAGALETAEQLVALRRPKDPEGQLSRTARGKLVASIRTAADAAAPGWLGSAPDRLRATGALGEDARDPVAVRIGTTEVLPGQPVPVLVPTLGLGHVVTDQDARDPYTAAIVRGLVLRIVAALPAGALRIVTVDAATAGALFVPFAPLVEAGIMEPPLTTHADLRGALDLADRHIRTVHQAGDPEPYLLIVLTGLSGPTTQAEWSRLAALAHAGPAGRTHLLLTGVPPGPPAPGEPAPPALDHTTVLRVAKGTAAITAGAAAFAHQPPIRLDPNPPDELINTVCRRQADNLSTASSVGISALVPAALWHGDATVELRSPIGREGPSDVDIVLGDSTPHCLIGGRTGSGKTVFLLDLLYGLAARYSPDELMLYLLDFKEGVSFSEFTPSPRDETWLPHVRAVGIESDRNYGVAVLAELQAEMLRRSTEMKRTGTTRFAELRAANPDLPLPRIVTVIDEFQVLFAGNDRLARRAVSMLEDVARKGRSYGIHLVLASQTTRGIEALYAKGESIFGQFALRVALPGATGVLDPMNTAAAGMRLGTAILNREGGAPDANQRVRFPNAHADPQTVAQLRHRLWKSRHPLNEPPAVFRGFAEHRVQDDPTYQLLRADEPTRKFLIGRSIDVAQSTAQFTVDASPGKHLAAIGTDPAGADVVHAAALGLGRQHQPGTAQFIVGSLVVAADAVAADLCKALQDLGHTPGRVDAATTAAALQFSADPERMPQLRTYLVLFGLDATGGDQNAVTHLRRLLRSGPAAGVHLLGWWRGSRRFSDDIGGASGREDVGCLVLLNISQQEIATNLGLHLVDYEWRSGRALLVDRHEGRTELIVPFTREAEAAL